MDDRESTQLLSLAKHYLRLANEGLKQVENKDMTAEQVAQQSGKYHPDGPIDAENEVFGHLASAAIRLATLAEKHQNLNLGKNYRRISVKELHEKIIEKAKEEISGDLSEYIHFLFRDNTGHIEGDKKIYAKVRKEIIPKISLSDAHDAVKKLFVTAQLPKPF